MALGLPSSSLKYLCLRYSTQVILYNNNNAFFSLLLLCFIIYRYMMNIITLCSFPFDMVIVHTSGLKIIQQMLLLIKCLDSIQQY